MVVPDLDTDTDINQPPDLANSIPKAQTCSPNSLASLLDQGIRNWLVVTKRSTTKKSACSSSPRMIVPIRVDRWRTWLPGHQTEPVSQPASWYSTVCSLASPYSSSLGFGFLVRTTQIQQVGILETTSQKPSVRAFKTKLASKPKGCILMIVCSAFVTKEQ